MMKKIAYLTLSALFAFASASSMAQPIEKETLAASSEPQVQQIQTVAQEAVPAAETAEKIAAVAGINQVNLNTATAAEIQDKLVGIGAKKAQAIVEYREKNGAFISIEQVTEVSGIGKATLDKNRDRIVLK